MSDTNKWNRVKGYVTNYGIDFVIAAIERAIDLKESKELRKAMLNARSRKAKREGEIKIMLKAKELGVRLG